MFINYENVISLIIIILPLNTGPVNGLVQREDYPNVSDPQCGFGAESALFANQSITTDDKVKQTYGNTLTSGQMPYLAIIHYYIQNQQNPQGGPSIIECYGAIINKQWVLTTAHCISCPYGWQCSEPFVILGINNRDYLRLNYNNVFKFQINDYYFNWDWQVGQGDTNSDLALLRVRQNIILSAQTQNAVCLPQRLAVNAQNEDTVFTGNGMPTAQANGPFYWAWATAAPPNPQIIENKFTIEANMLPTQRTLPPDCQQKSSGIPMVQYVDGRAVLIGLFTNPAPIWGNRCTPMYQQMTRWVRISMQIDWMLSVIQDKLVHGLPAPHTRIQQYPQVTEQDCGLIRSAQDDSQCFPYFNTDHKISRIYDGRASLKKGELTFMVFVDITFYDHNNTKVGGQQCTGSIINKRWVLTAQHCLWCDSSKHRCPHTTRVIAGEKQFGTILTWLMNQMQIYKAVEQVWQTTNIPFHFLTDIALIRVEPEFDLTDRRQMSAVCLPQKDILNAQPEYAVISGWGKVGLVNGSWVPLHIDADAPVGWVKIEPADSNRFGGRQEVFAQYSQSGSIICPGDSGGPLVQFVSGRAVLIGVASLTTPAGAPDRCSSNFKGTMHWARVSTKIDWIISVVTKGSTP